MLPYNGVDEVLDAHCEDHPGHKGSSSPQVHLRPVLHFQQSQLTTQDPLFLQQIKKPNFACAGEHKSAGFCGFRRSLKAARARRAGGFDITLSSVIPFPPPPQNTPHTTTRQPGLQGLHGYGSWTLPFSISYLDSCFAIQRVRHCPVDRRCRVAELVVWRAVVVVQPSSNVARFSLGVHLISGRIRTMR